MNGIMRRLRVGGVGLTLLLAASAAGAETTDPALAAAQRAFAAGQPVAALQVLDGHPALGIPGDVRLLRARACLALGRSGDAASTLAVRSVEDLTSWPERLRGAVAALNGEILLAAGEIPGARAWLEQGLRLRGAGVEVDRTLVLLAEVCERLGDPDAARRSAHVVWRDWPRSIHGARAGVIEARLLAVTQPDEARALLAGVRALDRVEPGTRLVAAELLCQLLLTTKPGQCLVVAEQETVRLSPQSGRLPLYRHWRSQLWIHVRAARRSLPCHHCYTMIQRQPRLAHACHPSAVISRMSPYASNARARRSISVGATAHARCWSHSPQTSRRR
jgi:Tetratricopeptide repeat